MYRKIYEELVAWKQKKYRKPLVLNGARQVGKTWILKEFGNKEYESIAYINCDNNPLLKDIFYDFDMERLIRSFSAITNVRIEKEKTLIILDEIQECPLGLTSLKYFCENAPKYPIVVAGSLLGIHVHQGTGFPVGKVDQIHMYPMSFEEFLLAMDQTILCETIQRRQWEELSSMADLLIDLLRQYYYVGGMPEVVSRYIEEHDIEQVRLLQYQILDGYKNDFSKHVPKNLLPKVDLVWNSIPAQLARENKKFIFGILKSGGRAKEFEDAIQWLIDAGLVYKVNRVSKLCEPLHFYEDFNSFKLFILDLGLLGALTQTPAKEVLIGSHVFEEYKGAFTEQYVAQQLVFRRIKPYYYTNKNSTNEIDFVIQMDQIHLIEVKAEENLKSKSLQTVLNEHQNMDGWRFSMSKYRERNRIINIPLYLIQEWLKAKQEKEKG